MAKFYIDDHHNISGDHYMDQKKGGEDMIQNNDSLSNRLRRDLLNRMCSSELLFRIQNGINRGETCVLKILYGPNSVTCPEDHDCNKCICEEICKKL